MGSILRCTDTRGCGGGSVLCVSIKSKARCLLAVEEKPWWRWAWEWVAGGFAPTPRYAVDWGLLPFVVSLGIEAARRSCCAKKDLALPAGWRRLLAYQDPKVNSDASVRTLTLPPKDGIVLVPQ